MSGEPEGKVTGAGVTVGEAETEGTSEGLGVADADCVAEALEVGFGFGDGFLVGDLVGVGLAEGLGEEVWEGLGAGLHPTTPPGSGTPPGQSAQAAPGSAKEATATRVATAPKRGFLISCFNDPTALDVLVAGKSFRPATSRPLQELRYPWSTHASSPNPGSIAGTRWRCR